MKTTHVKTSILLSERDMELVSSSFISTKHGLKCKYCGSYFWSIVDAHSHIKVCRKRIRSRW
ncbi:MAG: hypothetical protein NDF55_10865 [archaeon GB-1867-005]|nr:hypothetical protein [Candidatus Culexmicrobium cathedralense]